MYINKIISKIMPYVVLECIVIIGLLWIFRYTDLAYPLVYQNGDEMGVYGTVKSIKEFGIFYNTSNPNIGGLSGGDLYDYVLSDTLSYIIVKKLERHRSY